MAQVQHLSQNLLADQLNHNLHTIIDYITGQSTCSEDWTSQLNEIKETLKPENENNNELEKLMENEEIPESEDGSPGLLLVEWALSSAEKLQVLSGALKHLEFNKALEALESSTSNQGLFVLWIIYFILQSWFAHLCTNLRRVHQQKVEACLQYQLNCSTEK